MRERSTQALSYETRFIVKSFVRFIQNGFTTPSLQKARRSGASLKYYEGKVRGLGELHELIKAEGEILVGFTGGTCRLRETSRAELQNRDFKWNRSLDAPGINKRNWIPAGEFQMIVNSLD